MDSMRHLSTSLPNTRRRQDQPELLGDFRAAALSVTNLYKTAAASHDKARAAGYQDALDDLLVFLDKENLGLMDGEGWRVRQWATERLVDDGLQKPVGSDDDDGSVQEEQSKAPAGALSSSEGTEDLTASRRTAVSEPPHSQCQTPPPPQPTNVYTHAPVPSIDEFTFRSSHIYPSNHDRNPTPQSMDVDTTATSPSSTEGVRIISRPARARHYSHLRQRQNGSPTISLNLAAGAGGKRKLPYPDFFDISGVSGFDGRDGREGKDGGNGRGGKRGRHV